MTRAPAGVPTGGQFAASTRTETPVSLDDLSQPTLDQSYCDLNRHQGCSGYTEDESDPETCMCNCHDLGAPR